MSILDSDIKTTIPITEISANFLAGMGFARTSKKPKNHQFYGNPSANNRREDMVFVRIKYGYKIVLSIPSWSDVGTLSVAKVRRTHAKTRYVCADNQRIETVEEFIEQVNKRSPKETYVNS